MALHERLVIEERVNGVAVITFNRPERHNALNDEMSSQWTTAVREAISDPAVTCILLRGEGASFSSGRDTAELGRRMEGESDVAFIRKAQSIRLEMLEAPKMVIAAVQGYALGGAFEIALAADMRVAATDAVFAFPEVRFGLVSDTGGSQFAVALAGPAKAKYLLATGDRIDAATAKDWGIVDWIVDPSELHNAALAIAERIASAPPTAVAFAKQLVDDAWKGTFRSGMAHELIAQVALFSGDEHRRAKAARLEELAEGPN